MVRGLNYIPFKNNYVFARLISEATPIIVNEISRVDSIDNSDHPAGQIIKLDEEHFYIACQDSIVSIDGLMNNEQDGLTPVDVSKIFNLKEGDIITQNTLSNIDEPINIKR
jgi:methionyl-tRNA formyltransferase